MGLFSFGKVGGGYRLLRDLLRVLGRIADALERQNELFLAGSASARMYEAAKVPRIVPVDLVVSYPDVDELERAEEIRARYAAHGRHLTDEEIVLYLDQELGARA